MIGLAKDIGKPKAVYAESFIDGRNGDAVRIDGVQFTSRMLVRNLKPPAGTSLPFGGDLRA